MVREEGKLEKEYTKVIFTCQYRHIDDFKLPSKLNFTGGC